MQSPFRTRVKICGISSPEEARSATQLEGLDICSGVRTNGHLDEQKLEAFMNLVR